MSSKYWAVLAACMALSGCAVTVADTPSLSQAANKRQQSPRIPVSVGAFDIRSPLKRALSSEDLDRLSKQSQQLLLAYLRRNSHFQVADGNYLGTPQPRPLLSAELVLNAETSYVITGNIIELGRRELKDHSLFSLMGQGNPQVTFAKVELQVVDPSFSRVVHSVPGAAEQTHPDWKSTGLGDAFAAVAPLNNKNDNVLDQAIRDAVQRLVASIDSGAWTPAK